MRSLVILKGDGIGPEIVDESTRLLDLLIHKLKLDIKYEYGLVGGASIDESGEPLTEEVLQKCKESDAVILGAVGGPKWESTDPAKKRPEDGLLALRKELGLFANLRPVRIYDALIDSSTLKPHVLKGVDILVVRELTGGIYFSKRERVVDGDNIYAYDTEKYESFEIERIARLAFETARIRRNKLTSIDKANVLESSRLWREILTDLSKEYKDVELNHMYIDNAAMQVIRNPKQFDVIVTSNMFGDIISDETAMISGSIGLLPSASIGLNKFGMYEPIHGSAPDIAGQGKANPIAQILSLAMLFKYSLEMPEIFDHIGTAVGHVLEQGYRTVDIYNDNDKLLTTTQMGMLICETVEKLI